MCQRHMQNIAKVIALAITFGWIGGILQGCGHSPTPAPTPRTPSPTSPTSVPTPAPTPAPSSPTPPPPPPPPDFCDTASCCKDKAQNARDGQVCDDFYNVDDGIAFTMVSMDAWNMKQGQGIDNAAFYEEPPASRMDNAQEAMTLGHFQKGMMPWGGWSQYGFIFGLGQSTNFWKYFQKNKGGDVCGFPHDGFRCCPACRMPLGDMSYEDLMKQVRPMINQTQKNSWNEFDVNGLSSQGLYGVMIDRVGDSIWHKPHPDDPTMCKKLQSANPTRKSAWPIYIYEYIPGKERSSVKLDRYLDCDKSVEEVQI